MKFLYQYKTSENELRDGVVSAASRDAVYLALKKQGVRPSRVELAPGVLNRIAALGKRVWTIAALAVALAVSLAVGRSRAKAPPPAFDPSPAFEALSLEVSEIVGRSTNDFEKGRAELRRLFAERFAALSEDEREREAAKTLYGEASLEIDRLSDEDARRRRDVLPAQRSK